MKEFGAILIILGIIGILYFQFEFDTSMNIESGKSSYSKPYSPQEKDSNLELLQDQQNYTFAFAGISVAGAILLVMGIN
jgi:hypothetical protein